MAPLTALVHYNGRAIDDDNIENNVSYDEPKTKVMTIKTSFTLEMLKLNLHKKLGLSDNAVVVKMAKGAWKHRLGVRTGRPGAQTSAQRPTLAV
ncbi:hypothetical protein PIB30_071006 [Stylosanthes scabra]|uniref:Ubiquitin-like domain-containing protein n=1 Tax=Stylosanthes scabra TaxID=79078 RepID=A0ABU6RP64_9FABA|nr:hypothetical protein [Stylosanthes scabra]